jgi:ubiquinone/menaquinone biosynthesis C-methylase UbiE
MHSQHYPDEFERRKWQNPEEILKRIGLREGMTFVDIGCGEGFFAIAAARMVGASGKVIGVDINEGGITRLRERADNEGLNNMSSFVASAEVAEVCSACADFVFFGIDLHDFKDASMALKNARRMLKPGGKLVDLDWKKKWMLKGPPASIRFSQEYAIELIQRAGFKIETAEDSGRMHYLIIASLA